VVSEKENIYIVSAILKNKAERKVNTAFKQFRAKLADANTTMDMRLPEGLAQAPKRLQTF